MFKFVPESPVDSRPWYNWPAPDMQKKHYRNLYMTESKTQHDAISHNELNIVILNSWQILL